MPACSPAFADVGRFDTCEFMKFHNMDSLKLL